MKTILVQMADKRWTMQALHLALALARNAQAQVVLLRLIRVRHLSYLGSAFGRHEVSGDEQRELREYCETAEDYGVALIFSQMQCEAPLEAVVEAADLLDADVVFAQVLPSRIPYWQVFSRWWLEQRLALHGRHLYTLNPNPNRLQPAPMITVKPARHGVIK